MPVSRLHTCLVTLQADLIKAFSLGVCLLPRPLRPCMTRKPVVPSGYGVGGAAFGVGGAALGGAWDSRPDGVEDSHLEEADALGSSLVEKEKSGWRNLLCSDHMSSDSCLVCVDAFILSLQVGSVVVFSCGTCSG